jgi:hypothetical protein
MSAARFEPAVTATVRPPTKVIDCATTEMGETVQLPILNLIKILSPNVKKLHVDGLRDKAKQKEGFA